jgi:hypothetical protein
MFNTYTLGEHSRHSPGLILLRHMVVDSADRGLRAFDLGVGKAEYKSTFCDEVEPLFDHNFDEHTSVPGVLYFVELSAPSWSLNSRRVAADTERLSHEFPGRLRFARVNIDRCKVVAGRFAVSDPPVFVILRGGEVLRRIPQYPGLGELRRAIETELAQPRP